MIIRKGSQPLRSRSDQDAANLGRMDRMGLSDAGGLTQYGVFEEVLHPGAKSSDRHWHEQEDEFLYVLAGTPTLVDDHGAQLLHPGDAVAWQAGDPNGHQIVNRSDLPCSYLILGTRLAVDRVHYPDLGRTQIDTAEDWKVIDNATGRVLRSGRK